MLRLVGGPSVNTLPLTPFECNYPVSMAPVSSSIAFIRLLWHVCLATLRAVTTPSVIAFSVVH